MTWSKRAVAQNKAWATTIEHAMSNGLPVQARSARSDLFPWVVYIKYVAGNSEAWRLAGILQRVGSMALNRA